MGTKLERISQLSKENPDMVFISEENLYFTLFYESTIMNAES